MRLFTGHGGLVNHLLDGADIARQTVCKPLAKWNAFHLSLGRDQLAKFLLNALYDRSGNSYLNR